MVSAAEQERLRGLRFGSAAVTIELVERSRWLLDPHLEVRSQPVACGLGFADKATEAAAEGVPCGNQKVCGSLEEESKR